MDILKMVGLLEKNNVEQWTFLNTFPDIIRFIEDLYGGWIVGQEVLTDTAYDKKGNISGTKEESLKSYLKDKSTTVLYEPKAPISVLSNAPELSKAPDKTPK